MEPFTIQCATCQSLIRVRNPKMIGQIVNCPKCNSMLQITPPETAPSGLESLASGAQSIEGRKIRVESHRGVIDSSAMTKEAFAPEIEDEYRLAPSQVPEPALHSSTKLVAPPLANDDPIFEDPFSAPPLPSPKLTKAQVASQVASQAGTASSLSATESNHIQLLAVRRTARRRQVLMVAVLGSSGVLLAGMLFAGFLYWYTGKASSTIAKNSDKGNAQQGEPKHVGPKREAEQEVIQDPLDPATDPLLGPPATPVEGNATPPQATETEGAPKENTNSITSAISNAIGNPDAAQLNLNNGTGQPSEPNPSNPANNVAEQPTATETPTDDKATNELPDQLKKFQSILDTLIEPQFLEDQPVQKAPPTAKELGLSIGPDSKALPAVDIGKQLELPITGLIIPPNSIANTISQWVQISGIPTVVDLDSLVQLGIDRHKSIGQIAVKGETTMSQVAELIAKEIGVEAKTFESFFAFQAAEEAIREQLPKAIKISDLVDNDKQPWLVKTLEQIWPEYEGKWIVAEGELTVDPAVVDVQTWFWAVRMLESWRVAAGVETQLDKSKYEQAKFVTKFVDPEQLPALNTPLNIELVHRASVAQLVSQISSAGKMHAWVDWASVSQRGLGPNTIDFIVTKNRKMRECLRDVAEKYSLEVACEDDKSIVITTTEVYRAQPRLFVLPSEGKTAEQWMEELQPLTPGTVAAAQPVQAYLTPDSEFVIVRCCRPRLRK